MQSKSNEWPHAGPPPYRSFPHPFLSWKTFIVGISIVLSLVVIIIAASLTGLYLTQKHTEKMVTMIGSQGGQNFRQTISVNDREDVALISVTTPQYSHTILFDYNKKVIGIRRANGTECLLLGMDKVTAPSIEEILLTINYLQSHEKAFRSDTHSFIWRPVREADQSEMGMNVKLLCSGVPVYWGQEESDRRRNVIADVAEVGKAAVKWFDPAQGYGFLDVNLTFLQDAESAAS